MSKREINSINAFLATMFVTLFLVQNVLPTNITSNRFLQRIQKSFAPVAFAESDGYGHCFAITPSNTAPTDPCSYSSSDTLDYCMLANSSLTINSYLYATSGETVTDSSASQSGTTPTPVLAITPAFVNNPSMTPIGGGYSQALYSFQVDAPASSNDATVSIDRATNFSSPYSLFNTIDVHIIGSNHHPILTNLSPDTLNTEISPGGTANLPVSVQYQNPGGYVGDLTFELSNDNFQSILQVKSVANVAAGSAATTTFTGLGAGSYTWRAIAKESNLPAGCANAVDLDPAINVSLSSTRLSSGTITYRAPSLTDTGDNQQLIVATAGATMLFGVIVVLRQPLRRLFKR